MRKLAVILVLFFPVAVFSQEKLSRSGYIEKYWRVAVEEMERSGIPASITLAQACLESDNGNSYLAVKGNNHFGIKCHGWTGKSIRKHDDRRNECFRKYGSAYESFRDHSDFLMGGARYSRLFDLDPYDYEGWAYGLSEAGYATNPQYPELLINIIEDNGLARFDRMAHGQGGGSMQAAGDNHENTADATIVDDNGVVYYGFTLSRECRDENGAAYIVTGEGETIRSIAKEFSLTNRELKRYNGLDVKANKELPQGMKVYVSRKK